MGGKMDVCNDNRHFQSVYCSIRLLIAPVTLKRLSLSLPSRPSLSLWTSLKSTIKRDLYRSISLRCALGTLFHSVPAKFRITHNHRPVALRIHCS